MPFLEKNQFLPKRQLGRLSQIQSHIIFLIEGRSAKLISNVHFNRAASREYGSLSELDKEELVGEAPSEREMTCQTKRRTRTIF